MDRPRLLVVLRAAVIFCLAEGALRLFSIGRTVELFGAHLGTADRGTPDSAARSGSGATARDGAVSPPASLSPDEVSILAVVERIGRRWPFGPRGGCLRQSLVAAHVVRRHDPCIRIAVESDARRGMSAHSWVEVDGEAVTSPGALHAVLTSSRAGSRRGESGRRLSRRPPGAARDDLRP